ncbi:MAG: hypothetical protein IJH04_11320 [Eggerthellaceae bacterium]|nr:hypothetical protein [Eggerthellaceae bacterium]
MEHSMIKRFAVTLYDLLSLTVCATLLSCAFAYPAFAYVDPSVMTYTIQALAGVAVALSAVAGVAFRRTRKALLKALNIDENANKEVDPILHRIASDGTVVQVSADAPVLATANSKKEAPASKGPRWPMRLILAVIVAVFCVFTLCIVAPFEIVAGARGDLTFGLDDVWVPLAIFSAIGAGVLALLLSFFPKKVFTPVLAFVFAVGLCCYVQAMFLNGGLPQADGRPVDWWGDHGTSMIVSAIVWVALIVVVTVVAARFQRPARFLVSLISIALIFVQGVGVASLFANRDSGIDELTGPVYVTESGLFEVSPKNNVVVFILDYYDTRTLQNVLTQSPGMLDEMEGFTWYQNSTGVMIPTGFALPYLMTGQTPTTDQTVDDFLVTRWTNGHFLKDLHDSGYSVGVYTTTFGFEYLTNDQIQTHIYDGMTNAHPLGALHIDDEGAVKMLMKAALYRDVPWVLKPRFLFYTDDVNQRVVYMLDDQAPDETVYVMDDAKYFQRLQSFGLTEEKGDYEGAFRMIHLNGDHFPFSLNEKGEFIGEWESTKEAQAIGTMLMVSTYLKQMKELGVYDDATVIITADHGDWDVSMDLPQVVTSPILLVKNPHAGSAPVVTSSAPVSHEDLFGHVLNAMGQDYASYGGTTFDSVSEGDSRERFFYYITHDQSAHIHSLLGYTVNGDVLDFDNWEFTGDVWPCDFFNH